MGTNSGTLIKLVLGLETTESYEILSKDVRRLKISGIGHSVTGGRISLDENAPFHVENLLTCTNVRMTFERSALEGIETLQIDRSSRDPLNLKDRLVRYPDIVDITLVTQDQDGMDRSTTIHVPYGESDQTPDNTLMHVYEDNGSDGVTIVIGREDLTGPDPWETKDSL